MKLKHLINAICFGIAFFLLWGAYNIDFIEENQFAFSFLFIVIITVKIEILKRLNK